MATVTIQITAGAATAGRVKTVSSSDLLRFIAAWKGRFGTAGMTDAQVIELWADMVIAEAKRVVHVHEEDAAVVAARAGIGDIAFT